MAGGRRTSLASLATQRVEDVPGRGQPLLIRPRVDQVATTPENPRQDFGDEAELRELGESLRTRQLQPIVVVGRATYLRLFPDHAQHVGSASYVLASGERRLRAAQLVGLETIEAVVREDLADSPAAFLDAVLSENLDRKNFDPIEEAHAVEAMVRACGTAATAAKQLRRTEGWVSQRRALLRLTEQMQTLVRAREMPVRVARSLAALPAEQQADAWQREQEVFTAVKVAPEPRAGEAVGGSGEEAFTAVKAPSRRGRRTPPGAGRGWESPETLADLVRERFTPAAIARLIELLSAE